MTLPPEAPRPFRASSLDVLYGELLSKVQKEPTSIPVITGPTATGKSKLALRLALEWGGEIVSCDAMQVYQGFDIGTAKASPEEKDSVPHHMLDILDPCQRISVASYSERVHQLLESLLTEGKKPILCGGSVQYIAALLDGLEFAKARPDPALRERIGREIERQGLDASWERIRQLDPQAAETIDPADRRRIGRFFEIHQLTGLTKTEVNRLSKERGPRFPFLAFWLDWQPRQALYKAIDRRAAAMFKEGLAGEVAALMEAHPNYKDCPAFRGIGYKETVRFLEGHASEEEAEAQVAQATRRYAKRQQTWLRKRRDLYPLIYEKED